MVSDNTQIRILYLTSKSDLTRGGQRSLLQFIQRLDSSKYKPAVIVPFPGPLSRALSQENVRVFDLNLPSFSIKNPMAVIKAARKLRYIIKDVYPDIIHVDTPRLAHFANLVKVKAKLVMHLRVATPDGFSDRLLAKECDQLVAISRAVTRRFVHLPSARDKIKIIFNGIDTDEFKKASEHEIRDTRDKINLQREGVIIGLLAGFDNFKGHDFLLDQWPEVLKKCKATLVFAGDKPEKERDRLQQRIKSENLENSAKIIPFINQPEKFIPALDVVLLPSLEEGFGRVLIEAAACEVPIVASDIAGIDEAVENGKNGLLAPARDAGKWVESLVKLIENKTIRTEFGEYGRKMVLDRFTLDQNVEKVTALYDELVGVSE